MMRAFLLPLGEVRAALRTLQFFAPKLEIVTMNSRVHWPEARMELECFVDPTVTKTTVTTII